MWGKVNVRFRIFEDEIWVYWEKPAKGELEYVVYSNGVLIARVQKTHYRMTRLVPESTYIIRIDAFQGKTKRASTCVHATTLRKRRRVDVTAAPYFAVGDGECINTVALQAAFDACGKGDCLYFPQGRYLTGGLDVPCGVEIYLEKGACLLGMEDPQAYLPKIDSRYEGIERKCYRSLLNIGRWTESREALPVDVCIRGGGEICGGGFALAENTIAIEKSALLATGAPTFVQDAENQDTVAGRARGRLIHICCAENVTIAGITLRNGPAWNVHAIYSKNIVVADCCFGSENIWNGDGFDPDSSENCVIYGCNFQTGDDCIAVKSGKNPQGNSIAKPTKGVEIFDCFCEYGHGIAIGSEISGGVQDVRIWDCDFKNSGNGLTIKSHRKRGGYIRNVTVENCVFSGILIVGSVPYNMDGESAKELSEFARLRFENVYLTGRCFSMTRDTFRMPAIKIIGYEEDETRFHEMYFKNTCIEKYQTDECAPIVTEFVQKVYLDGIYYE